MKLKSIIPNNEFILPFLFSLFITITVNLNLELIENTSESFFSELIRSFSLTPIKSFNFFFVFIICCFITKNALVRINQGILNGGKIWLCHIIPAAVFAVFMLVGHSFYKTGNSLLLIANNYQILKVIIISSGYFLLFFFLILLCYDYLDHISFHNVNSTGEVSNKFTTWFFRKPGTCSFLVLLFFYLPYVVLSYPAILTGDFFWQFNQAVNIVHLSNHHPVMHTLLLSLFISVGKGLDSYNFGIFLYALFQLCFFLYAVSFAIMLTIKHCNARLLTIFLIILFFIFHPRIQAYMMLVTKDIIYTAVFLIFYSLSFLMLVEKQLKKYHYIMWILSIIGIVLMRNDGIYLVAPMLLFWGCTHSPKKLVLSVLLFFVSFFIIWNRLILPGFHVSQGSMRELLSIPFQQTARYVKLAPAKITSGEKKAIDGVLDYKNLSKNYNPRFADPVKSIFKEKSTKQQRQEYLKTWFSMFQKAPKIYIDAVLANKYEYFYPCSNPAINYSYKLSLSYMKRANTKNINLNPDFHYPAAFKNARESYENARENIFKLPVLNMLLTASNYVWIVILLLFYIIKNNMLEGGILIIPCIMQFLVLIAGPTNGSYFRYVYPLVVWLPFLFIFIMNLKQLPLHQKND